LGGAGGVTWLGLGRGRCDLLLVTATVRESTEDILQSILHEAGGLGVDVELRQGWQRLWLLWLHLPQTSLSHDHARAEDVQGHCQGYSYLDSKEYGVTSPAQLKMTVWFLASARWSCTKVTY